MSCKVIKVIEAKLTLRGTGKEESPMRLITEYYDLDGNILAEVDPAAITITKEEIFAAIRNTDWQGTEHEYAQRVCTRLGIK